MLAEVVLGLAAFAIGIASFALAYDFPTLQADPGGTALLPQIAAVGMALAAFLFLARLAWYGRRRRVAHESSDTAQSTGEIESDQTQAETQDEINPGRRTAYVIALSVLYPFVILEIGLTLASIVYSFFLMKLYRTGTFVGAGASCAIGLGLYVFFVYLVEASIPSGRLTKALLELWSG